MKHIGTQYIETQRLILRRLERSDAHSFVDNIASDDEVTRFLSGWPKNCTVPMMEGILDRWISQYSDTDCYNWAIVLKEDGTEAIGQILVFDWDEKEEIPNLGGCIGKRWWNRGIMTEALGAVLDSLFNQVGVRRIEGYHDQNNPAAGTVMKKCGMKYKEKQDWACWYSIDADDR